MKAVLNKKRSTHLEGSSGTEKEHYGIKRIRARSPETQNVWLSFGIFTANAVRMAKRVANQLKLAA